MFQDSIPTLPTTSIILSTAMMSCYSSNSAFENANRGLLNWNTNYANQANDILRQVGDATSFHQTVARKSIKQFADVAAGVKRFTENRKKEPALAGNIIWEEGSSAMYNYGHTSEEVPLCLLIPSLINKAYIFDLSAEKSVMKNCHELGLSGVLLDWGIPSEAEKEFSIEDYINRLNRCVDFLYAEYGKKIILVGYCMGGLFSLVSALEQENKIAGVAYLATPWDFSAPDIMQFARKEEFASWFASVSEKEDAVSGALIYYLLYLQHPWKVNEKFAKFAYMQGEEYETFLERESWVHDNVPLVKRVARECFIDWAVHNKTAKGTWQVNDKVINPRDINIPSFVAIGGDDVVVPQLCTAALSKILPDSQAVIVPSGHVGMVVGNKAQKHMWLPLANWAKNL